jgi:hypothetical protein
MKKYVDDHYLPNLKEFAKIETIKEWLIFFPLTHDKISFFLLFFLLNELILKHKNFLTFSDKTFQLIKFDR